MDKPELAQRRGSLHMLPFLQALGLLWALPVSVLGFGVGLAAWASGAQVRISRRELAVIFQRVPWGPGGALTLGNVILDTGKTLERSCNTYAHDAGCAVEAPISMADHERAHVYQYMVLGVLFLPLYLLLGGVSARNPLERAADRYARDGRGWWPWLRE